MAERRITVRLFAAAAQTAGAEEVHLELPERARTVDDVVGMLPELIRSRQDSGAGTVAGGPPTATSAPPLEQVCARSSFLLNEQRAQRDARVSPGDVLDVLPPFAGG